MLCHCYNKSKKPKKKHLFSITLGWMYNGKSCQKGKYFKRMRVLLDSGCGGTLVNRSFVKKYKKDGDKVHQLDYQGRHFQDRSQGQMSVYLT
jgi:hypothetical protein